MAAEEEQSPREYLPETQAIIDQLLQDPTIRLRCAHGCLGDDPIAVYEVPRGCVALPGVQTQPLCQHHRKSNGSFEGMISVIDLSIGAGWSQHMGEAPDYWMHEDPATGEISMLNSATYPIPTIEVKQADSQEELPDDPLTKGHRIARFFSWLGRAHLGIE